MAQAGALGRPGRVGSGLLGGWAAWPEAAPWVSLGHDSSLSNLLHTLHFIADTIHGVLTRPKARHHQILSFTQFHGCQNVMKKLRY